MINIETSNPIENTGLEDPMVEQLDLASLLLSTYDIPAYPDLTHSLAEYIRDGVIEAQSPSLVSEIKDEKLVDPTDRFFDRVEEGLKDRSLISVLQELSQPKTLDDTPIGAELVAKRGILAHRKRRQGSGDLSSTVSSAIEQKESAQNTVSSRAKAREEAIRLRTAKRVARIVEKKALSGDSLVNVKPRIPSSNSRYEYSNPKLQERREVVDQLVQEQLASKGLSIEPVSGYDRAPTNSDPSQYRTTAGNAGYHSFKVIPAQSTKTGKS